MLSVLVLVAIFASLVLAVWGVQNQPVATFYLLPMRAWELLLGAFVATLPEWAKITSRISREIVSWCGVAGILIPFWGYSHITPFPGLAALPPCVGTALVIWANSPIQNAMTSGTFCARLLSLKFVVFIGLISYSLYLWHWPVIAFWSYWQTQDLSYVSRLVLVFLSLLLGFLSWKFVEIPFRAKKIAGTRIGIFMLAGTASLLTIAVGVYFSFGNGLPGRLSTSAQSTISLIEESTKNQNLEAKGHDLFANKRDGETNLSPIVEDRLPLFGGRTGEVNKANFIVLGDSHAQVALSAFKELASEFKVNGTAITHVATPPLKQWPFRSEFSATDPTLLWRSSLEYIKRNKIEHTFLVAFWSKYEKIAGPAYLERFIVQMIAELESVGTTVWLVLDVPTYKNDIARALLRDEFFPLLPFKVTAQTETEHRKKNQAVYNLQAKAKYFVLDPSGFMLDSVKQEYQVGDELTPYYKDNDHLTTWGVNASILPSIKLAFEKMALEVKRN